MCKFFELHSHTHGHGERTVPNWTKVYEDGCKQCPIMPITGRLVPCFVFTLIDSLFIHLTFRHLFLILICIDLNVIVYCLGYVGSIYSRLLPFDLEVRESFIVVCSPRTLSHQICKISDPLASNAGGIEGLDVRFLKINCALEREF